MSHTPEIWEINSDPTIFNGAILLTKINRGKIIADISNATKKEAKIIAAAPELLEALRQTKHFIDAAFDLGQLKLDKDSEGYFKMCAAIAKAEGKA